MTVTEMVPLHQQEPDRKIEWRTALDNYEPAPRDYATGTGEWWDAHDVHPRTPTIILRGAYDLKDATKAIYLVDTGRSVTAMFVAGWHPEERTVLIQPLPLSLGVRADNGQPIDMSGWMLGPRRCYHLKVTETA